ncbi:MAG: MFS transporter, partial [Alphaproteobacteria bacterium]|nr:MFS transporter [Alphaproteobacteria bacterium]
MRFFTNDDTRRLQIHSAFHSLAIHMAAIFSAAYLLKSGLTPSQVFLTFAGIYAVRIVVRPLMIAIAPAVGLKALLIAGSFLIALSYAAISIVDGFNWKLVVYAAFAGLANMVYWTAFHPAFAAAGESHDRGRQVGARQSLSALASIAGPVLSGALLTIAGPWAAFGFACLALLAGIVPLFAIADTPVARVAPPGAWRAALPACGLFAADGFVWTGAGVAWHITL